MIISKADLASLQQAKHATPHAVLGMHPLLRNRSQGVVVRAFLRGVAACEVVELDAQPPKAHPMKLVAPEGGLAVAQMLKQAGLTASTTEAMRMIEQGGVRLDGERLTDRTLKVAGGATIVAQVGKRKFARIHLA